MQASHLQRIFITLADLKKGQTAVITQFQDQPGHDRDVLEKRLLSMGFVEGMTVTVRHLNWLGGDPIVVEIHNGATIALRKKEALMICVQE